MDGRGRPIVEKKEDDDTTLTSSLVQLTEFLRPESTSVVNGELLYPYSLLPLVLITAWIQTFPTGRTRHMVTELLCESATVRTKRCLISKGCLLYQQWKRQGHKGPCSTQRCEAQV